jgi:hypothetical protein
MDSLNSEELRQLAELLRRLGTAAQGEVNTGLEVDGPST